MNRMIEILKNNIMVVVFLCIYTGVVSVLSFRQPFVLMQDGAARFLFSNMVKDILFNLQDFKEIIFHHSSHYLVGVECLYNWMPLQAFFYFLISLIGIQTEPYIGFLNYIFLIIICIYIIKTVKLLGYKNNIYSLIIISFFLLNPIVFYYAISGARSSTHALFFIIPFYYLIKFDMTKVLKYFVYSLIFFVLGILYNETTAVLLIIYLIYFVKISLQIEFMKIKRELKTFRFLFLCFISFITILFLITAFYISKQGQSTIINKIYSVNNQTIDKHTGSKQLFGYYSTYAFDRKLKYDESNKNFQTDNEQIKNDIKNYKDRFSQSHFKKFYFVMSTIFNQWITIPLIVFGLYLVFKNKKKQLILSFFFAVLFILLLSYTGSVTVYISPAFLMLCLIMLPVIKKLKYLKSVSTIIIIFLVFILFFNYYNGYERYPFLTFKRGVSLNKIFEKLTEYDNFTEPSTILVNPNFQYNYSIFV